MSTAEDGMFDDDETRAVAEKLRERDPDRFARVQADLEKAARKSIDDLDPVTSAEIIVELAAEDDPEARS